MPKIFCLLNHPLTANQLEELQKTYKSGIVIYPPETIKNLWSHLPIDNKISKTILAPIISWLEENKATGSDVIILQGEAGNTFALVDFCLQKRLIPIHAVTQRIAKETSQGETVHREYIFKHICFRPYEYYKDLN